jgi:hypothetical protein
MHAAPLLEMIGEMIPSRCPGGQRRVAESTATADVAPGTTPLIQIVNGQFGTPMELAQMLP